MGRRDREAFTIVVVVVVVVVVVAILAQDSFVYSFLNTSSSTGSML